MNNQNLERLEKAGLFETGTLNPQQKELIGLLSEAEVTALISSAHTLGFERDAASGYLLIL